ncbi:sigma-70 family RNA polymerase sigma factor [Planctomicrobium sp. SH661]|uniref:sigma-70 family RNA polymerase sigma factor n=1 Tax=Planctomicrobium sp. SH661 TaxID=3448124 RepID=UPI003F5AF36D
MLNRLEHNAMDSPETANSRETIFLRQFAATHEEIYASALSIVGCRADAVDVVQEVCVVLWTQYEKFEQSTNFSRWACTVAFNVAKNYARKQRRRRGYGLSDQMLSKMAQVQTGSSELLELQKEILLDCMDKLSESDRDFFFGSVIAARHRWSPFPAGRDSRSRPSTASSIG